MLLRPDGSVASRHDHDMLAAVPDLFVIPAADMLKATAATENGERVLHLEASNPNADLDGEQIVQAALRASSAYYLEHGNLDIDHLTLIGHKMPSIDNPYEWEIGQPTEVKFGSNGSTYVKGRIYHGHDKADWFWETMNKWSPPKRWYPSVGGHTLAKGVVIDKKTGRKMAVIKKVRWINTGLSNEAVNHTVKFASVLPIGSFAKSFGPAILASDRFELIAEEHCGECEDCGGCSLAKTLTAGYGTDSAGLTGGGALRRESLHGKVAASTQGGDADGKIDAVSAALLRKVRNGEIAPPRSLSDVTAYFVSNGIAASEAKRHAATWLQKVANAIKTRRSA